MFVFIHSGFSAFFAVFWLATATSLVCAQHGPIVQGKTILHPDGTRTESVSDPNTKEMEAKTFDTNGILLVRRLYQLNDQGQPVMGNIYDGAGNLQPRTQSFFHAFSRLQEERSYNLAGECYQQVLHSYDLEGKAATPKVINYQVQSPTMRPAVIDFTDPNWQDNSSPAGPNMRLPTSNATTAAPEQDLSPIRAPDPNAEAPSVEEKPKTSFWKKLFRKGED